MSTRLIVKALLKIGCEVIRVASYGRKVPIRTFLRSYTYEQGVEQAARLPGIGDLPCNTWDIAVTYKTAEMVLVRPWRTSTLLEDADDCGAYTFFPIGL